MKHTLLTLTLAGAVAVATGPARAGSQSFVDTAKVIDVEPIVRSVRVETPRRECWDEEVPARQHGGHGSAAPMIVGGLVGGIVGHQIGRRGHGGRGVNAGTVAGTLIGAAIGHDHGAAHHRGSDRVVVEERCHTYVDYRSEERIDGYWVTYRYKGEEFRTRMREAPGDRLQVRVLVTPLAP